MQLISTLALATSAAALVAPAAPKASTKLDVATLKNPSSTEFAYGLPGNMIPGVESSRFDFDPLGFAERASPAEMVKYREAELKHGRVAMLAATGVIWVEAFGPLPGWPEADGRSQMDVFWDAWEEHPNAICAGIVFITAIELISGVATTMGRKTGERAPGDFGLNPLQFEITEELALKEIKHGRLAMWAVMGQIGAGLMTGEPAFANLGKIFS